MFYFGVPPAGRGGGGTSRQERDTHMKDSRNERLRAMFAGRGYYIAIALCLVAAGTIGYFALRERPVTVEQTDTPPVLDIQPVTPTQPVVKPAPVVIPDPVEEAEITEPAELLPQVVSPLDGTTVTVFSMTELLYDPTMADWRTHDGIDVQADEGAAVKTAAAGTVQSVTDDELMGTTVGTPPSTAAYRKIRLWRRARPWPPGRSSAMWAAPPPPRAAWGRTCTSPSAGTAR